MESITILPPPQSPPHTNLADLNLLLRPTIPRAIAGPPAPDSTQDAAAFADEFDTPDAGDELPAVFYPLYTTAQLHDFIRRITTTLLGATEVTLAAVSEPGLYTLTAALFHFADRNAVPPAAPHRPSAARWTTE